MSHAGEIRASVLKFFSSHPIVGIVSFIASLLSIAAIVYTLAIGRDSRELAYRINPVKTSIVRSGQYGPLSVFVGLSKIETDVTAIQVAVWNRGRLPIFSGDVIEGVQLILKPSAKILDAEITKTSRSLIGLAIIDRNDDEGRLSLSWKVLEHNDGGVVQIILAGIMDTDVEVIGAIIGQPHITRINNPKDIPYQQRTLTTSLRGMLLSFTVFFPALSLLGILLIIIRNGVSSIKTGVNPGITKSDIKFFIRYFLYGILSLIGYLIIPAPSPRPPFGF